VLTFHGDNFVKSTRFNGAHNCGRISKLKNIFDDRLNKIGTFWREMIYFLQSFFGEKLLEIFEGFLVIHRFKNREFFGDSGFGSWFEMRVSRFEVQLDLFLFFLIYFFGDSWFLVLGS
jgi:hypothetical protein